MRLTPIIILLAVLQLSARDSRGQKLTYNKKDVTISELFREIKRQTGYSVVSSDGRLNPQMPIDVNFYNTPLKRVFDEILFGRSVTYEFVDKIVVIKIDNRTLREKGIGLFATIDIRGRVLGENNEPLVGAVVKVKGTKTTVPTDKNGEFFLKGLDEKAVLVISFLGYETIEIKGSESSKSIKLVLSNDKLNEVEIVSTGYQNIPKERATGSFVLIDSALFHRKVSTNILERLDGVTSGVLFNKNKIPGTPDISIRGRSTIFASSSPLIILDNFPYDGDISNINPQDVKSITVLKDASAASIWGARAGNGVIVITTNKGHFNQKPLINLSSNITIGEKPDQYYREQLTNQQYIEIEQFLFDKGKFNSTIDNKFGPLSPAVEIMLLRRNNLIDDTKKASLLNEIAGHDNRTDIDRYFYRKSINQQYQLNVDGGGQYNKYFISMGYDNNEQTSVSQRNSRLTLNANNSISLLNNKLELLTGILFSVNNNYTKGSPYVPSYPYDKLSDDNGNSLEIAKGLRLPYVDTAGKGRLLDWRYKPLDELSGDYRNNKVQLTDYRISLGANYTIISNLKISLNYTYNKGFQDNLTNQSQLSYDTRNMINQFSQINQTTGVVTRIIPIGDILTNFNSTYYSHYGRGQISYNNTLGQKHELAIIAGYEIKDYQNFNESTILYGYDPSTAINANSSINPLQDYKYYYSNSTAKILTSIANNGTTDRFISYYTNGSYVYDKKYTLSVSARKDESNLFGVKPNQKGVPLWSAGIAWNINNEDFYNFTRLPYLKLRTTFGYNGNVDKTTTAYLTAVSSGANNLYGNLYQSISNPPNPSLRWERIKIINLGLDFGTIKNKISGSLELWFKNGIDLIGRSPIAPQTGINIFKGNSANIRSQGFDFTLNTQNISNPLFKWTTMLLINYATDKITSYKVKQPSNNDIIRGNYDNPLEGYSYYSLFSYKWMGLDNAGNPQSILNGQTSTDYAGMSSSLNSQDLVYSGTIVPKYFGSVMNTFSWKSLELSFNLIYKFDYYFRRTSLDNSALYNGVAGPSGYQIPDYDLRWQKTGDELLTNVPKLIYPVDALRNGIYTGSDILVEKGDHIRLQDLRLNYLFDRKKCKNLPFSNLNLYVYASNLGIIWKATDKKIDPDSPFGFPNPKMIAFGIKANL